MLDGTVQTDTLFMVASMLMAIVSMVCTAIWTVANVKSTTAVLAVELRQLREAITRLDGKASSVQEANSKLEIRVTVLEESIKRLCNSET